MSQELVDAEEGWQRLSPLSIVAQLVRTLFSGALPASFVIFGAVNKAEVDFSSLLLGSLVFAGILAIAALMCWLSWVRQRYLIGESDIRFEAGLISRMARSVPFERIQDVSLEQKLLPRLLGLVEVRFETGAGGKDELKLAFVSAAEGERLRETVRMRTQSGGASTGAEETDPAARDDLEPSTTIFAMDERRLFTFGLFEFSLIVFAVLIGATQQFDGLLPFDLWDADLWREQIGAPQDVLEGLSAMGWIARIAGIAAMLGGLLVLGLATGLIRTVLRDYGFRLDRTAKGFRRRRGLLTKTDVVMPVHRVQAIKLGTGLLRRLWGWHNLSFISLAQDAGSANHDVAPFAQMDEIAPIAAQAGFQLPRGETQWHHPSPLYYRDRAALIAVPFAIAATVVFAFGHGLIALAPLAVGSVLIAQQYWLWRTHRHALDPAQILSRRGWFSPLLMIASRVKLHSAEVSQGPLARRHGYASLKMGLAGGRLTFAGLPLGEAQQLRAAVLESIAAVDFARLPR